MPVKIYEPIKSPDIEAIRWFGDNWDEVKKFMGDKLINENFLFAHPLTEKKKENACTEQGGNQYSSGIPNSTHPNNFYNPEPNYFYFGQQGWICPRCGRVNAPFMSQCTCRSEDYSNTNWTGKNTIDEIKIDCDSKNTKGNKIN